MKRTKWMAAAAGEAVAFGAGQLTAQPPEAARAPARVVQTPRQQAFMADLSAAVKGNNDAKTIKMLGEAAGDAELTNAVVEKMWNYAQRESPAERNKGETMQATFAMQQRQKHIELMQELLFELKRKPNN